MWRDNVEEACSVLRAGAHSSGLEALGLHRWTKMVPEALSVYSWMTIVPGTAGVQRIVPGAASVHSGNYSLMRGSLVQVKVKIVV